MNFRQLNETIIKYIPIMEENEKPFKFTIDYDDGRPEDIIEYGVDEDDAKANLLKTHKYLQGEEARITNIEPVKEDHEEVTLPFTLIYKSSEGPDVSGEVTFIPAPFGYEYDCSVKEFNGHGPQWSTIRTLEGIKIWFRNVLFEFGAKTVTIGDETWDIDDFPKDDMDESSVTFADRCNWINEDGKELQFAIEQIINKFDTYGNNYDEEKQQIIVDRILEILEQATTNLNDIAKRMK